MESRGDLSLYEYLYRCIRHDIAHGKVEPGQKLPSKRALAKQLGVSLITIEAAYDQLVAEGYIRSRERCGYYACALAPAAKIEEPGSARRRAEAAKATATNRGRENHAANPNGPQPVSQDGERPKRSTDYRPTIDPAAPPSDADFVPTIDGSTAPCPQNTPSDAPLLADFTHSTLATTMLPYSAWAKAVRQTLSDESAASLAEAASAAGSPELRSAIADHLRQYRGMDVSPDQVVIGAGSQTLYQLLVQLLGRTRRYAVEDPGYPLLTRMYEQQDAQVAHIGLDDSGIDIDALETSDASVAHIMPSHQFPTGIVTTATRRRELLNWAREGDRYLIEDDYDSEFRMAGRPIPSLFGIDAAERVLYLNSFAKSLGAAFRMAYLVLPPQLAQHFRKQLGFYANTVSPLYQLALARFIKQGHYDRHVNRLRTHARKTQDALVNALREAFGERIAFAGLNDGLHFIMQLESERGERELATAAKAAGIRIAPLSSFAGTASLIGAPTGTKSQANTASETSPARFILRSDSISIEEAPAVANALAKAWAQASTVNDSQIPLATPTPRAPAGARA